MGRDTSALFIQANAGGASACFVTDAPTSATDATKIILDGVKADRLRILAASAAQVTDAMVRDDPDHASEPEFYAWFAAGGIRGGEDDRRAAWRVRCWLSRWRWTFALRRAAVIQASIAPDRRCRQSLPIIGRRFVLDLWCFLIHCTRLARWLCRKPLRWSYTAFANRSIVQEAGSRIARMRSPSIRTPCNGAGLTFSGSCLVLTALRLV